MFIDLLNAVHGVCRGRNVFLQANVLVRFAALSTTPTPRCPSLARNGELQYVVVVVVVSVLVGLLLIAHLTYC